MQGAATAPDADLARQRQVVDAFFAAARDGDFDALLAVLDPDVVLRGDRTAAPAGAARQVRGARRVAEQALTFSRRARRTWSARPALVNGAAGVIVVMRGRPFTIMGFTVREGKIVEIYVVADRARLRQLDLAVLGE